MTKKSVTLNHSTLIFDWSHCLSMVSLFNISLFIGGDMCQCMKRKSDVEQIRRQNIDLEQKLNCV